MPRSKDEIRREMAREEARLAELERCCAEAERRIAMLKEDLRAAGSRQGRLPHGLSNPQKTPTPRTSAEKIHLFQSLFRGRPDVFPTRFVSRKTGKAGYSPACENKWEPGICALRHGGKCGDCTNQAFVAVDDKMILDHLQGRHVMGVYPLLPDETCWFLAADFDKGGWQDDVTAFRYPAGELGYAGRSHRRISRLATLSKVARLASSLL
jgi:hypothetical protein